MQLKRYFCVMKITKEVSFCKQLLCGLGHYQKIKLLKYSSLTNRERKILYMRFVEGKTIAECSSDFNLDENSFNKAQQKCFKKLYRWISENDMAEIRHIISILN